MKALIVEPGPWFSVMDVARGWNAGLTGVGVQVASLNLGDRLSLYEGAHLKDPATGDWRKAFPDTSAIRLASKGILAAAMEMWPDFVIVISGFFIPPEVYLTLRARGISTVLVHTECPYENVRQLERAPWPDINLLNDPTDIEAFRAVNPRSYYMPHAYDPAIHHPGPGTLEARSDFCFVGTGYQSRIAFFEQVDWTGIDAAFAGHWQQLDDESPLRKFLAHDIRACCDNSEAVTLYQSTAVSANLYRKEAQADDLVAGWSIGPREVELAATGTFFLREPRPEGDELFPTLPTFTDPGDFTEKLHWWLAHPVQRADAARAAREAATPRTFTNSAVKLLGLLG